MKKVDEQSSELKLIIRNNKYIRYEFPIEYIDVSVLINKYKILLKDQKYTDAVKPKNFYSISIESDRLSWSMEISNPFFTYGSIETASLEDINTSIPRIPQIYQYASPLIKNTQIKKYIISQPYGDLDLVWIVEYDFKKLSVNNIYVLYRKH